MTKIGTSGSRKSKYTVGIISYDKSLPEDVAYSEKKCEQSEGTCEIDKTESYNKLVVNHDTLISTQLCQTSGINDSKTKAANVKSNSTRADEIPMKKLSRKTCITTSTENKERSEQNMKESTNRQKFLKLCNIRNQTEDPDRLSISSFSHSTIKPINYKQTQEFSFRDLISTNVDSISYSSEDSSPLPHCKHSDSEDKSPSVIYPHISTRWRMSSCDRNIGTIEEEPLLLYSRVYGSNSNRNSTEYDPNLIAKFDSDCSTRKTVMKFSGYVSTIMQYQPDNEVKRLVNDAFRLRFPYIHVSLSKIKSIERELHQIAIACNLEDATTAHAYVFYEIALLKGLVCKTNRKLVAGAALLIAAKITDFGSMSVSDVINYLESSLRINRKELVRYEIPLCAALSFNLRVPIWQLLPHYQRISLTML
ncbi:CDK5 and ABL1 enzyme substrate [Dirofilaria immitis]